MLLENNPLLGVINSAANRYNVDPKALVRIAQLESNLDPRAQNPRSSAGGLFQFIDSSAKQYGLSDRFDPNQSADAAARLMRDNALQLRRNLGRDPLPGELYLAHQQGATGASRLLTNPNARAVDIVGEQAVLLNGGRPDMTAGEFANMWINKAGGDPANQAPGAAVAMPVNIQGGQVPQAPQSFANPVLLAQAGGGGVPMPQGQQSPATRDLLKYMSPQVVSMIPEDQRADFYSRMRRMMGVQQMAGGNPLQVVQQMEQQLLAPQMQQHLSQIFNGSPQGGGQPAQPGQPGQPGQPQGYDRRTSANRYFQAAQLFASQGDGERAKKYLDMGMALHPNPSEAVRDLEYFGFNMQGQGQQAFDRLSQLNESKRANTNVNVNTGPTAGMKKIDEKFAESFADWTFNGGFSDTIKQLEQLGEVTNALAGETGITGPGVGSVPGAVAPILTPRAVAIKEKVEEVVQRNLRLVLGAQFTEKEGERLISRAFNPKLSQQENLRRVQLLTKQIRDAAEAKQQAAEYFNKNQTLQGWNGSLFQNFNQFLAEYDKRVGGSSEGGSGGGGGGGWSIRPRGN